MKYLFYSLITIVVVLLCGITVKAQKNKITTTNDATILHAWCWSFNTIR